MTKNFWGKQKQYKRQKKRKQENITGLSMERNILEENLILKDKKT